MTMSERIGRFTKPSLEDESLFVAHRSKPSAQIQELKSLEGGWTAGAAILIVAGLIGLWMLSSPKSSITYSPKTVAAAAEAPASADPADSDGEPDYAVQLPVSIQERLETAARLRAATSRYRRGSDESMASHLRPDPTGMLTIRSSTPVDIYIDDQFAGSAPTSLELQAGIRKVEYRHDNMSKVVRYFIKPNDTTRANVKFE